MNPDAFSIGPVGGGAQGSFPAVFRVLRQAIAAGAFPGCAFGVLTRDGVVLQDALGLFTDEPGAAAVLPSTVFDLASVSKVVATTAAAMLLAQAGRLNLDARLSEFLPEFAAHRAADDPALQIRLRHLLAHSSGLPGYVEFFKTATSAQELLLKCLSLRLEAAPGARAAYSDPGFILLGKALESCASEPLDLWTRNNIFTPLGMASTCFNPPQEQWHTIPPTEEDRSFRRRRIQGEVQDENAWVLGGVAGHAGVFSNVPDLLRFSAAILQAESASPESKTSIFQPESLARFALRQPPEGSSRALGWDTPSQNSSAGRYFSSHSIGHLGYSGCSLWIDLDAGVAIVLLTNRTWPDRGSQLIRQVRPEFHNALCEALDFPTR